jgi:hypothetical protein
MKTTNTTLDIGLVGGVLQTTKLVTALPLGVIGAGVKVALHGNRTMLQYLYTTELGKAAIDDGFITHLTANGATADYIVDKATALWEKTHNNQPQAGVEI